MIDFREVLNHCNLYDLGFTGLPWTYDNMKKGDGNVRVRLDRVVASSGWMQRFANARLHHIVSARSDHCPILMEVEKDSTPTPPRSFRFKIM
jgi:exonuclease III